jgi:hypothetical protein
MAEPIDYQGVLADLEARKAQAIAQFDAAIASIRGILAGTASDGVPVVVAESSTGNGSSNGAVHPAPVAFVPRPRTRGDGAQIESDTFFGLTTAQAIKKFLTMTKRPQTPKAMADALHDGGQLHARDAATSYRNAYTALMRLAKAGQVVQTRKGDWGLAEWYSNKPAAPEPVPAKGD